MFIVLLFLVWRTFVIFLTTGKNTNIQILSKFMVHITEA